MTHGATRGHSQTRLYRIWSCMKTRVGNPSRKQYSDYGGRGISICTEWKDNFTAFRDWAMKNGYRDDLTIDRIDNDRGYYPDNCKWSTRKEQTMNRRTDNSREVICIETGMQFRSAREAANCVMCGRTNIVEALSGRSMTAAGFHWKYADCQKGAKNA